MPSLPFDLWYAVCAQIVAECIDDQLLGPLRHVPPSPAATSPSPEEAAILSSNPVIPLLQTSLDVRRATLHVLSDALSIPVNSTGVGSLSEKPWSRIHPVRVRLWEARHRTWAADAADSASAHLAPLRAPSPVLQMYELCAQLIGGFRCAFLCVLLRETSDGPDRAGPGRLASMFQRCPVLLTAFSMDQFMPRLPQAAFKYYVTSRLLTIFIVGCQAAFLTNLFEPPEGVDGLPGLDRLPADAALATIEDALQDVRKDISLSPGLAHWDQNMGDNAPPGLPPSFFEDYCGFAEMVPGFAKALKMKPWDEDKDLPPLIGRIRAVFRQERADMQAFAAKLEERRAQILKERAGAA
ncbi:hypothetical protein PsYK624_046300 [Phanerochaete sordida]|uniref:Uncharacterized protein n=1 Tax=Phanerochaete sordida TaxID=48140 RepID=A0A9P3G5N4_9APHY|nr:hypothetical protein PsYK624_046300 [Phanerochaete sordida]